jgi:hypothetical protein
MLTQPIVALHDPIAPPVDPQLIIAEVNALPEDQRIVTQGGYSVFVASSNQIPNALLEIGRLRELTFRAVGEGTRLPDR